MKFAIRHAARYGLILPVALCCAPSYLLAQTWSLNAILDEGVAPVGSHVTVDITGDLVFVAISNAEGGTIRLHERDQGGQEQWGVLATVHRDDPWFARSIAFHDGRLAVGSPATDAAGPYSGEVRMYAIDPQPGADALQPMGVLVLDDATGNDRFGYAVHWLGDTLAVSAVGRAGIRSFGEVFLFDVLDGVPGLIAPLPSPRQDLQTPFIRWFGTTMAFDGDRLVVVAPFTGFEPARPQQNIGSLHLYHRDGSSASGWVLDSAWADMRVDTTTSCSFLRMELGRWGVAFTGDDLVVDNAASYDGTPGNPLEPWLFPDTVPGCDACGLHFVAYADNVWDLSGSTTIAPPAEPQQRAVEAWMMHGDALYAGWYDPTNGSWSTAIHRRDQGGPGAWGVDAVLMATDACDRLDGPLATDGARLVRVVTSRGSACDAPPGSMHIRAEVFGQ